MWLPEGLENTPFKCNFKINLAPFCIIKTWQSFVDYDIIKLGNNGTRKIAKGV